MLYPLQSIIEDLGSEFLSIALFLLILHALVDHLLFDYLFDLHFLLLDFFLGPDLVAQLFEVGLLQFLLVVVLLLAALDGVELVFVSYILPLGRVSHPNKNITHLL